MLIIAQAKNIRTSPRKLRLVADLVRPLPLDQAVTALKHLRRRAALPLAKVFKQAQSNAVNNFNLSRDKLTIKTVEINTGPTYKRARAANKGRSHSIKKRTSHIKIVLEGDGPKSKS